MYRRMMDAHYLRRDLEYSLLKAFEYSRGIDPDRWMKVWASEWNSVGVNFYGFTPCVSVIHELNRTYVKTSCEIRGNVRGLNFVIPKGYGVVVWSGG